MVKATPTSTIPVAVSVGVVVADHIFEIYTDCIFTALSRRKQIGLGSGLIGILVTYVLCPLISLVIKVYKNAPI